MKNNFSHTYVLLHRFKGKCQEVQKKLQHWIYDSVLQLCRFCEDLKCQRPLSLAICTMCWNLLSLTFIDPTQKTHALIYDVIFQWNVNHYISWIQLIVSSAQDQLILIPFSVQKRFNVIKIMVWTFMQIQR